MNVLFVIKHCHHLVLQVKCPCNQCNSSLSMKKTGLRGPVYQPEEWFILHVLLHQIPLPFEWLALLTLARLGSHASFLGNKYRVAHTFPYFYLFIFFEALFSENKSIKILLVFFYNDSIILLWKNWMLYKINFRSGYNS